MQIIREHFNKLADVYNEETSWRMDKDLITSFIKAVPKASGQIIELGCGTGIISNALNRENIIGVDCSEKMCELYEKNNLKAICSDVKDIPISNNSVELFLIRQLLQYFNDEELSEVLDEIERIGYFKKCIVLAHHFVSPENKYLKEWLFLLKKHIQPLRKNVYTADDISKIFKERNWINDYEVMISHTRKINISSYFSKSYLIKNYKEFSEWLTKSAEDMNNDICISFKDNVLTYRQPWVLQRFIRNNE